MKIRTLALAAVLALSMASTSALAFGAERFAADKVQVDNLLGSLVIKVVEGVDGITVQAEGKDKDLLRRLSVTGRGDKVVIDMDIPRGEDRNYDLDDNQTPTVTVTVPSGADLRIVDMIGALEAESGLDEVDISLNSAASMEFGRVRTLLVDAKGALNLEVGDIADGFDLAMEGAGNIETGAIVGATRVNVKGMSNVDIARVDGPLVIALDGIGRVNVEDGRSEMLEVELDGLGSISYGGVATDKRVSKGGMGSVSIAVRAY